MHVALTFAMCSQLEIACMNVQAHMELDIQAKIQLLVGIVERPEDVPIMIRKQPQILALSEVTIQVRFFTVFRSMPCVVSVATRSVWTSLPQTLGVK